MSEADTFASSGAPLDVKLDNFEKYVRRQSLTRFLARYELFRLQEGLKGSIIECGVHHGGGLLAWAKLSSALEPYAIHRRVYGFDTFEGFPSVAGEDRGGADNPELVEGGFAPGYDSHAELVGVIRDYDDNRFLEQFDKVQLVRGDVRETVPAFVAEHPHLLVSLLFLDLDLYEPTAVALEHFLPRMARGGVIAFDEINNPWWPGETQALLERFDLRDRQIKKFPFDPNIAYMTV